MYGLTWSFFGRCDLKYRLKILLKKESSSQLLLDRFREDNDEKNEFNVDNDGAITVLTVINNNRTSLVTKDKTVCSFKDLNALAFSRLKLFLEKASLLQLLFDVLFDDKDYGDGTNNSSPKYPVASDNRTIGLVTNDDYHIDGSKCRILPYNNS